MNRSAYYEQLKGFARDLRAEYGFATPRVTRSDLRRIYSAKGIKIDLWDQKLRHLRGAYFADECGTTVLIAKGLPEEPTVFTMAHELKHHFHDHGLSFCDVSNENSHIEIGAEVYAAELIFPEQDFLATAASLHIKRGQVEMRQVVHIKHETRTTFSYTALVKRFEFFNFIQPGEFAKVHWKKLEEEIYGEPVYKRIQRRRAAMTRAIRIS